MTLHCRKCGVPIRIGPEFENDECPRCGSKEAFVTLEELYAIQAAGRTKTQPKPLPEGFAPSVIGDEIHGAAHDYTVGQTFTSKRARQEAYDKAGMNMYSADEYRRKQDGSPMPKPGVGISYAGQKDHRSTAERGGVRTPSGRRVE